MTRVLGGERAIFIYTLPATLDFILCGDLHCRTIFLRTPLPLLNCAVRSAGHIGQYGVYLDGRRSW